jgi:predicted Zn-dependent protease
MIMSESKTITPDAFLSKDECKQLFDRIVKMTSGGGKTSVSIVSQHSGAAKWVHNKMYIASDSREVDTRITRDIRGASGSASTSMLDDDGLRHAIRQAEIAIGVRRESYEQLHDPFADEPSLTPNLWSDSTYSFGVEKRAELVQSLLKGVKSRGMISAGDLLISGDSTATIDTEGMFRHYPQTVVECSMTVRHPKGIASGWSGVNHHDLSKIDPQALATTALDKCLHSQNPVPVEPGRYTVVMEPQATADLFRPILENDAMVRVVAERPNGPFGGKEPGRSKITEQVLDKRLVMGADPMDPEGGFLPYDRYSGVPYQPVNWIDRGILRELEYNKDYALSQLGLNNALPNSKSFRLEAAEGVTTTTVEDMISKTERGILVTRFSGVQVIDFRSMLCSGYTRDGLWLIERGKITKPIKNFRFTESPLFALNSLEDVGAPRRVFAPGFAHIAPAVRVRDFSFTSLADAV